MAEKQHVDFWFDPLCPWAWMTSRWMEEVERVRDVEVDWKIISLGILNEDNPDNHHHGRQDSMWLVRVVEAAAQQHGDEYRKKLYDAMGTRRHPRGMEDLEQIITESLAEVGLPAELASAKDSTDYDAALRASTDEARAVAGKDIGTPVIAVNGTGFFGPVFTPAPKGEEAGKVWDGALALASYPGFYELKRGREKGPDFS
ncbi:DsbA family protein [Kocuria rhizophila]|uniref:mycothiol-dependent nitroreductase Rv2466c family protein n=1 Tax=Kocuria TaxID=57493 RepID=UPI00057D00D7|nr:DsbA family protein [Kocuria rhizophila]KIC70621.1 DSBA oxidoreductase [Kocuria rhizophila]MCR4526119.1 DsbA family protein [Kocuria rhizophila]MDA4829409.1 DsbA family protein [Kocuria rhizophila]WIW68679.1 DsbA family protein [Kocuria sp. ChxB]